MNMNGKDNWVEWRHPQYLRDKSSSPLDKLLLKEPLVKSGSGEMRQNLQCLLAPCILASGPDQTHTNGNVLIFQRQISASDAGKPSVLIRSHSTFILPSTYSPPTTFPLCPVIKKWNFLPVDDHCNGAYSHSGGNGK